MTSNLTIDINWRPDHYFYRFWIDKSDPYVAALPFMGVGMPVYWALVVLALAITIKWIGPAYMSRREPVDVRPITLILDGLAFGGYLTGLIAVMVPAGYFMDCFDCSAYSPTTERYYHLVVKHFAFAIIFAKLFDFMVPVFFFLAKKPPVTNLYLLYLMCVAVGTVSLVKINPGGIFVFAAMIDGLHSVIFYSYLTFTAADPRFRPSRGWKAAVFFSKMLAWSLILAHSAYFLSIPNCGEPVIKLAMVVFSILVLVLFPYDFYQMDQSACDRLAKKDLQRAIRRASRLSMTGKLMMTKKVINNNDIKESDESDDEDVMAPPAKQASQKPMMHRNSEVRDVTRDDCKQQ